MKKPFKKYVLFGIDDYYPLGGLDDIQDSFDTLKEAGEAIKNNTKNHDYFEIVDKDSWEIVWKGKSGTFV